MLTPTPGFPFFQNTIRMLKKVLKESSYVCNDTAGFYRCITKHQKDIQSNLCVLQQEMGKDKSSQRSRKALDELNDLILFNQNVAYYMGKSRQTLG